MCPQLWGRTHSSALNILRLLLRFALSKLLDDGVKYDSLKSTIASLSEERLLAEPAYLDLSTWDEEIVVEMAELRIEPNRRSAVGTSQTRLTE
ncbi:hypothetical protein BB931_08065 [Spiribacter salinus]|nr:hypothetical protein [Spiribacter salinus]